MKKPLLTEDVLLNNKGQFEEVIIDYLATKNPLSTKVYEIYREIDTTKYTPIDLLYFETLDNIKKAQEFKKDFPEFAEEHKHLSKSNMKYQKELYAITKSIKYTHSEIFIPMRDLFDTTGLGDFTDCHLSVSFFDDLGVPKGKYKEYKKLKTFEERRDFIKDNIEITHVYFYFGKWESDTDHDKATRVMVIGEPPVNNYKHEFRCRQKKKKQQYIMLKELINNDFGLEITLKLLKNKEKLAFLFKG